MWYNYSTRQKRGDKMSNAKRVVGDVVDLAQDNIFLKAVIKEMTDFIEESGIFNYSSNTYEQKKVILHYFRSLALEKVLAKGYDMGVNTPWGKDAGRLYASKFKIVNNSQDSEFDDSIWEDDEWEDEQEEN